MEQGVVSTTHVRAGGTGLRSPLPLTRAVWCVALAAVVWVACWLPPQLWPVSNAIQVVTRANCNDDRNVRDPCIVPDTGAIAAQLLLQPTASNSANGNESLGPIHEVFGGLLGVPSYYTHLYVFAGSRVGGRPQLVIASAAPVPGPFSHWSVAQPVEQQPDKLLVVGSSPAAPTNAACSSADRARSCHGSEVVGATPITRFAIL